jgi:hypothetical protein
MGRGRRALGKYLDQIRLHGAAYSSSALRSRNHHRIMGLSLFLTRGGATGMEKKLGDERGLVVHSPFNLNVSFRNDACRSVDRKFGGVEPLQREVLE